MGLAERKTSGGSGKPSSADGAPGRSLERVMRNLEHKIVVMTAAIERKRHPERELAKEIAVLVMVMHCNRDPHSFAVWCNSLVKR